ncbi:RimK family alpha-L-glutamate ligase [Streptomyces varsoviensis]|uniref:RimK family alpha-L-glutamate ligase n=1 Tax=Streptomyces varsoviensis TaxID=67373 RepID=UPI00068A953E|nr:RimK family alpha-L-glutamate ligase [Streptomyces varsoviensis]
MFNQLKKSAQWGDLFEGGMRVSVNDCGAESVWLVFGPGLDQNRTSEELKDGFRARFGKACEMVRMQDLFLGVIAGRLSLFDGQGRELAAPRVAYARLSTPVLSLEREITLLRHLEAMGTVLVNPISSVLSCANKFWHLQDLAAAGIPVPDTRTHLDATLESLVASGMPEPCVVKAVRGHRGKQVFLAPDAAMLQGVMGSLRTEVPYLMQDYIASSHGRSLRVVVVDGRAVAAQSHRATGGRMVSNLAQGAEVTVCPGQYPRGEELAIEAARILGIRVAGVDLMFLPSGEFLVCEVNPNVTWNADLTTVTPAIVTACNELLQTGAAMQPDSV